MTRRTRFRVAVVCGSVLAAIVGSTVLATRGAGENATREGVTATLQVPSHPGSLVAGEDALWLALNRDAGRPVVDKPLLRLDLATGVIESAVSVGGEASHVTRLGGRLIASVQHLHQEEFGGRHLIALDWSSGRILVRRGFDGPVHQVVVSGEHLWAAEVQPATLLRLDPKTLAPTAPPLRLSTSRATGLAAGAGFLWVTAADDGELLRIDPVSREIMRIDVGGKPTGVVVAGGSVWYSDSENGDVVRRDARTPRSVGDTVHIGGKPASLTAAGGSVFAADADAGTISRIDVRTADRIGAPIRVAPPAADGATFAIAPAGSSVWVSSFGSDTVTRIDSGGSAPQVRTVVVSGDAFTGTAVTLPRGGRVVSTLAVPTGGALAVGEGAVWTMGNTGAKLVRIDPQTNHVVARIGLIGRGEDAVAGDGAMWVSHPDHNSVSRIDPSTNRVTASVRVRSQPAGLGVSRGAVWVANIGGPSVTRIDPATNRVVATIRVGPPRACCAEHMMLVAADDAVWVQVPNLDALVRIDPATNSVADTIVVPNSPCGLLVVDEGAVWYSSGGCGDVVARVDARAGRVTATLEGDPHPVGLAAAFGSLWVAALGAASIDRIDPGTNHVVARLPVGGLPVRLAAGFGSVWVSDDEGGRLLRIEPQH